MPRVTITVQDKPAQPYRFQLDREVVTFGRGSDNDIVIDSASVSGKHAEMHRIKGGYELRDVGSTNGIKLGSERYQTIPLEQGTAVKIGDVAFDFELADEEIAALSAEGPPVRAKQLPPAPPRQMAAPRVPQKAMGPRRVMTAPSSSDGGVGWMVALFFLLAAISFYVGLSIRHQKETGNSLLDDMRARFAQPVESGSIPVMEMPRADETAPVAAEMAAPAEETVDPDPEPVAPAPVMEEDEDEDGDLPEDE
jgi:pSer/pThr/pTyr-binding forkhead associated (FHA) protein